MGKVDKFLKGLPGIKTEEAFFCLYFKTSLSGKGFYAALFADDE